MKGRQRFIVTALEVETRAVLRQLEPWSSRS